MRFPGIIPAVTTPFDARGAVDTAGLAANVRFLLDAGVHGIVGTGTMGEAGSLDAADVAPAQCVALYEHCRAGELDAAREVYRRLLPLGRFDMTPKLVQYFKAAMDEVGLAGGPTRAPRLPLNDDERAALGEALTTLGVGVHA